MSYTLHIWDEPVPATVEEADQIASELGRLASQGPVNPKYAEAALQITTRFPFIDDPEAEADEVWSDGPLTPAAGQRLWGVGILSQHAGEVQPFVVSTSNALGLVVYDFQLGKAYLPDGKVLSSGPRSKSTRPWWKFW
jgi:hypothetical protein